MNGERASPWTGLQGPQKQEWALALPSPIVPPEAIQRVEIFLTATLPLLGPRPCLPGFCGVVAEAGIDVWDGGQPGLPLFLCIDHFRPRLIGLLLLAVGSRLIAFVRRRASWGLEIVVVAGS